uniref:Uncharacterized protein n=1 Tax=Timema genevievae TaxID=629358 RepID=A0A7R9JSN3_TIMGE|nr:unnamed protein product [Timema genevievae]
MISHSSSKPRCSSWKSSDIEVVCSHFALQEPPQNLSISIESLDISNNNISSLRGNFMSSPKLSKLYVNDNGISFVAEDAFFKLENLYVLDLSSNFIQSLHQNTFVSVYRLGKLDLSKNRIRFFSRDLFRNNLQLFKLNLSHNALSLPTSGTFLDTVSLNHIYLQYAHIYSDSPEYSWKSMNPDLFRSMKNLRTINLEGNGISELPENMFTRNQGLIQLNLRNNLLTSWPSPAFHSEAQIYSLDISNNLLQTLDERFVKSLGDLRHLNLSNNPFVCDCRLQELWFWSVRGNVSTGASCVSPFSAWGILGHLKCNLTQPHVSVFKEESILNNESSAELYQKQETIFYTPQTEPVAITHVPTTSLIHSEVGRRSTITKTNYFTNSSPRSTPKTYFLLPDKRRTEDFTIVLCLTGVVGFLLFTIIVVFITIEYFNHRNKRQFIDQNTVSGESSACMERKEMRCFQESTPNNLLWGSRDSVSNILSPITHYLQYPVDRTISKGIYECYRPRTLRERPEFEIEFVEDYSNAQTMRVETATGRLSTNGTEGIIKSTSTSRSSLISEPAPLKVPICNSILVPLIPAAEQGAFLQSTQRFRQSHGSTSSTPYNVSLETGGVYSSPAPSRASTLSSDFHFYYSIE